MRSVMFWFLAAAAMMVGLSARPAPAADKENAKDEAALQKNAEAFVEAFQKGDATAVAAFWTKDGDYVDEGGRHMKGRDEIEKSFKEFFADNKGLKLRIDSEVLRFVTPDVAVEDGVTSVLTPDGAPPSRARYTIVHVKKDGQWLLSSVRDAPYAPPSNYEHLRDLEWAIGDWVDDAEKGELARVSFTWSESENYILSSFSTSIKNITVADGEQRIGWDPVEKRIRSWTFEENGGFGEGTWTRDGDRWTIKTQSVMRDGKKITATNIVTKVDADTLTWQSKDRTVDGKAVPDIKEVKMKRAK